MKKQLLIMSWISELRRRLRFHRVANHGDLAAAWVGGYGRRVGAHASVRSVFSGGVPIGSTDVSAWVGKEKFRLLKGTSVKSLLKASVVRGLPYMTSANFWDFSTSAERDRTGSCRNLWAFGIISAERTISAKMVNFGQKEVISA